METKILICGSGPSLPGQLKGIDLSDFFVVRVNPWEEIKDCDNKCDAWAFYPRMKNLEKYLSRTKILWMPHFGMADECEDVTGIKPSYTISEHETKNFHWLIGNQHPTSGAVVIYMASLLKAKVYIAGFDFYQNKKKYYYSDEKRTGLSDSDHSPRLEKKWVDDCIENKSITKLGAN